MDMINAIILFFAATIGGFFDSLVGGGSLFTIPALIFLGLPPAFAIGTNRLGVSGMDLAGWYKFKKKKLVDHRISLILLVPAVIGAVIGANLVLEFNEEILKKIIAAITFAVLIMIMFNSKIGIEKTKHQRGKIHLVIGVIIALILGVYGGFYGAGVGTFLAYLLILFFGQTFLESAGTRKLPNLALSIVAAIVFAYHGVIDYFFAAIVFAGGVIGSYVGAHYSDRIGNVWIKRAFFVIVAVMVIKLVI
jgi:uncharacterized membrane protein YfcA